MFSRRKQKTLVPSESQAGRAVLTAVIFLSLVCLSLVSGSLLAIAQDQSSTPPPSQSQDNGKPKQDVPADAGGPSGNVGPYAIPKKKTEEAPPPPPPPTPKKIEDMPDYSLKVNVPLVNVDVLVTTKDGQFVIGCEGNTMRNTTIANAACHAKHRRLELIEDIRIRGSPDKPKLILPAHNADHIERIGTAAHPINPCGR